MTGKNHIKIFLITGSLLWAHRPQDILYFALGGLIGSLLPDIDHKQSIAGAIIPAWLIFKHAKQTHTLIACSIFLFLWLYLEHDFYYGLFFGYLSHLLADDMQGAPLKYLYYPFKRGK